MVLVILAIPTVCTARGPGWTMSMPVFRDDGDNITPFKAEVGTTTPVLLVSPDVLQSRSILIYNPSTQYQLLLGTSSNFNEIDSYWVVLKNSGTEVSYSHQAIWAMYPPGASSQTVRGKVEKQ